MTYDEAVSNVKFGKCIPHKKKTISILMNGSEIMSALKVPIIISGIETALRCLKDIEIEERKQAAEIGDFPAKYQSAYVEGMNDMKNCMIQSLEHLKSVSDAATSISKIQASENGFIKAVETRNPYESEIDKDKEDFPAWQEYDCFRFLSAELDVDMKKNPEQTVDYITQIISHLEKKLPI